MWGVGRIVGYGIEGCVSMRLDVGYLLVLSSGGEVG